MGLRVYTLPLLPDRATTTQARLILVDLFSRHRIADLNVSFQVLFDPFVLVTDGGRLVVRRKWRYCTLLQPISPVEMFGINLREENTRTWGLITFGESNTLVQRAREGCLGFTKWIAIAPRDPGYFWSFLPG